MAQDIYIDVNYLTESERDAILQVLAKDEDLRKQEKRRISKLKNELDEIKSRGASEEEIKFSRVCARCRSPFGLVFNTGALCPRCEARVCKECRRDNSSKWLCILCAKIREVRAESGAWFFEQEKKKSDRPQLYGSALVRASFRRAKLPSYGSHKGLCSYVRLHTELVEDKVSKGTVVLRGWGMKQCKFGFIKKNFIKVHQPTCRYEPIDSWEKDLTDFTLSNTRGFYSSTGGMLADA